MATAKFTHSWLDDVTRERFWAKVDKNGPLPDGADPLVTAPQTPCWVWTAAVYKASGYGAFTAPQPRAGKTPIAHRIAYLDLVGPIPAAYHVDHLCRNRACVNPGHLEAVTHRENILRGATLPAARASVTHCPEGHEYTDANTWVSARRQRHCRTCHRESMARYRKSPGVAEKRAAEARAYRARLKAEKVS